MSTTTTTEHQATKLAPETLLLPLEPEYEFVRATGEDEFIPPTHDQWRKTNPTTTVLFTLLISTSLHLLLLQLPSPPNSYITSLIISLIWIQVYKFMTGEKGIHPLINVAVTLGSGWVARWLREGEGRRGEWVVVRG